jgi:serine/threonine protein kinase
MIIRKIGQGSYGTVAKAKHLPSDTYISIKKIPDVFNNLGDSKRLLREVQILC